MPCYSRTSVWLRYKVVAGAGGGCSADNGCTAGRAELGNRRGDPPGPPLLLMVHTVINYWPGISSQHTTAISAQPSPAQTRPAHHCNQCLVRCRQETGSGREVIMTPLNLSFYRGEMSTEALLSQTKTSVSAGLMCNQVSFSIF